MWKAQFSNDEILEEFDTNGQEIPFRKVLDKLDDLENLSIVVGDKIYIVRMLDGRFSIIFKGEEHHFFALDTDVADLEHIRPIYFVRETVDFSTLGKTPGPPKINFTALGFQANLNGYNLKRYLTIFSDGTFCIKDK
ncbi:hypothetical protein KA005_64685 [bacterium]|nr:hypothetical protein [bacterium]